MHITSRKTKRVLEVTVYVTDTPGIGIAQDTMRYTPDRVTVAYSNEGAGWRVLAVGVSGVRAVSKLRSSNAWGTHDLNTAPGWIKKIAADHMPKDD